MITSDITVTTSWTKLAADTDVDFLASWQAPHSSLVAFAVTAADAAPAVGGHVLHPGQQMTRSAIGDGFVWAKVLIGADSVQMAVSK